MTARKFALWIPSKHLVLGVLFLAIGILGMIDGVWHGHASPGGGLLSAFFFTLGGLFASTGRSQDLAMVLVLSYGSLCGLVAIIAEDMPLGSALVWAMGNAIAAVGIKVWPNGVSARAIRLLCVLMSGIGIGLSLVELRLDAVGPLAYSCLAEACIILWVVFPRAWRPTSGPEALIGIGGILVTGILGAWTSLTVDPWEARPPSERFIIHYLEQRQALGEHFDQEAFLKAWDTSDQERPIDVGSGPLEVHLFLMRQGEPPGQAVVAAVKSAIDQKRISLHIHPVPGGHLDADEEWVTILSGNPSGWDSWVLGHSAPLTNGGETTAFPEAKAILFGSVRAMARFGVSSSPSCVLVSPGTKARLCSLSALIQELPPAPIREH